MKNNTLITKITSVALIALLTFTQSCKKSDVGAAPAAATTTASSTQTPTSTVSSSHIDELTQFLKTSTGVESVTYSAPAQEFTVDGDVVLPLSDVELQFAHKDDAQAPSGTQSVQQRKYTYLISRAKAPYIKIYADATVPAVWVAALDRSIANWNAVNSLIHMTRVTTNVTGATLVTALNNGNNSIIATTYYPDYYGNNGKKCTINSYYNWLSAGQQTFAITHELGHAVGLTHTNGTYGSIITGSPVADPNSIMNSVCLNWTAFTTSDKVAIQTLYPR